MNPPNPDQIHYIYTYTRLGGDPIDSDHVQFIQFRSDIAVTRTCLPTTQYRLKEFSGQNRHVCWNWLHPIHIGSTRLGLNLPDPSLLPPPHPLSSRPDIAVEIQIADSNRFEANVGSALELERGRGDRTQIWRV